MISKPQTFENDYDLKMIYDFETKLLLIKKEI